VGFLELVFRKRWKSLEEKWAELSGPHQVHDFLVGEHGVCKGTTGAQQHDEKNCRYADIP